jgi:hypothetical protein
MVEAVNHRWLYPTSILDVYKVCLSTFAVDGHMGAPLHCYTCAGGGKSLENWGKAEEKWHCGVMVEAVNHCWLHPTSILDLYKVFEHLHMLWMGISVHHYIVIPLQVEAKCWKIGVRRSTNHAEVSWVMLLTTADWISHPYWMYTNVFEVWEPLYAVDGHLGACLDCYTCAGWGQILENCGKVVPKWHCGVMVEAVNHRWLHLTFIWDV